MKTGLRDFAIFGGPPALKAAAHVAQLNLPSFDKLEGAFRGVFERRSFAGNGPLVREFEVRLADALQMEHVVCVTNGTVALMICAAAMGETGEIIVPAFTFSATAQAISWAGLTPVFCDVDPRTHMLNAELVRPLLTERTAGILGVHLWGHACAPQELEALAAEYNVALFYDACHAMGCLFEGRSVANFGSTSALSLHATKIVNSAEGGGIATNDSYLAAAMRDMRNFYSSETGGQRLRMNGKMSEAQAALGLLSLADLPRNILRNRERYLGFKQGLQEIPGVTLLEHDDGNNFQYIVVDIDETQAGLHRDMFLRLLAPENIICRRHFYPGLHRLSPFNLDERTRRRTFPCTERLCDRILQLPCGELVSASEVEKISELIGDIVRLSGDITRATGKDASE